MPADCTHPSLLQDGELTDKNCSVAVVGKDMPFTLLEDESLAPYITGGWAVHCCCACRRALLFAESPTRAWPEPRACASVEICTSCTGGSWGFCSPEQPRSLNCSGRLCSAAYTVV